MMGACHAPLPGASVARDIHAGIGCGWRRPHPGAWHAPPYAPPGRGVGDAPVRVNVTVDGCAHRRSSPLAGFIETNGAALWWAHAMRPYRGIGRARPMRGVTHAVGLGILGCMFDPRHHNRRTGRLRGYDYCGVGYYFITICAATRRDVFGQLAPDGVRLNRHGAVVREAWLATPALRPEIVLDEWVIMPDHFHALLFIGEGSTDAARPCPSPAPAAETVGLYRPPRSLGALVGGFKGAVTSQLRTWRAAMGYADVPIWQRNYYDHIVRHDWRTRPHPRIHLEQPLCGVPR